MKHVYMLFAFLAFINVNAQDTGVSDFNELDQKPEYIDGMKAFYSYVSEAIKTPEVEKDTVLKVVVKFVIEKDGSVSMVEALKDPGYGFAQEAVRVVKACPKKWTPGIKDGNVVRASYLLPISIKVEGMGTGQKDSLPAKPVDEVRFKPLTPKE
ncbi:energy transducer TonB [Flavobacterium akiainvivens]|uniref:energy transducer TonB n=1 Tax=Flavobacterium akiainvivens TaxID=1202724 RepID=UPI0006C8369C|nr:energy transducer TonB [Flavobacterium akiainvivens]SFQ64236.1 TonB protein C-terminal [Flavobacterium akiainvivens]